MEAEISLKEIFEKLIRMESGIEILDKTNTRITRYFTIWVFVIITLEVINILVHMFL